MSTFNSGSEELYNGVNIRNGQPLIFDQLHIPVAECLKNQNDNYLVLLINHREKVFFIGQTGSITVYLGSVTRWLRSGGNTGAGIPSDAVAVSARGNHKYWSVEVLKASADNWSRVISHMRGHYVCKTTRGYNPPPSSMNICRIVHTRTGWSRYFSEESTSNRSLNPSRRIGFQNGLDYTVRQHITASNIKDEHLAAAFRTLSAEMRLAIQTGAGVVVEIAKTFTTKSEIATVDTLVRNLNLQATRSFEKFLQKINPTDYIQKANIGIIRGKIDHDASPVVAEAVHHAKVFDVAKDVQTAQPSVQTEQKVETPALSKDTISLSVEQIENQLLLALQRDYRKDCEYIFSLCESHGLDIDDVCSAMRAVLGQSGIWAQVFGHITKEQVKTALYTNYPPEGLKFAGFFKIFRATVETVVREVEMTSEEVEQN